MAERTSETTLEEQVSDLTNKLSQVLLRLNEKDNEIGDLEQRIIALEN